MPYIIEVDKQAKKFLRTLNSATLYRRLDQAILSLAENPRPPGCVKLQGQPYHRIRVGDYRIVYQIKDDVLIVLVVSIGHRREIYR